MTEFEPVVAGYTCRLVGEAQLVENGIHEGSGTIAGERTPCAVSSMRTGSKTKDEHPCARVAKAGNRPSPVGLVLVSTSPGFADAAAVVAEARTALAIDDRFANLLQKRR